MLALGQRSAGGAFAMDRIRRLLPPRAYLEHYWKGQFIDSFLHGLLTALSTFGVTRPDLRRGRASLAVGPPAVRFEAADAAVGGLARVDGRPITSPSGRLS
jgi:hypothetical protein